MSDPDLDALEGRLRDAESALERVEEGRYGRCVVCGRAIEEERLASDPLVTRCESCEPPAGDEE